jgi:hypothetical protein
MPQGIPRHLGAAMRRDDCRLPVASLHLSWRRFAQNMDSQRRAHRTEGVRAGTSELN